MARELIFQKRVWASLSMSGTLGTGSAARPTGDHIWSAQVSAEKHPHLGKVLLGRVSRHGSLWATTYHARHMGFLW